MESSRSAVAAVSSIPAFERKLHVGLPNIGDRDRLMARISDMLDRRWLSNHGPYVREFEQQVAEIVDAKHCIALCNATTALQIAIRALGMTGEVIVPSFTFVATAHALQWQGITPVFCDIAPTTHNIDPALVESLITPRTTGIVAVHLWGRPCQVQALEEIARKHGLKLVFDAAHAFGCSQNGQMIGGFGDAEVFSFHATKFINTFEGGAVVTNDDALAERIRLMSNFGFEGMDSVIYIGTNGKMSEVSAAMGLTSLESMAALMDANRRNYLLYRQHLAGIPGISLVAHHHAWKSNHQYIVVEVDEARAGISRDLLLSILHAKNVIARRYFYPGCHRMEPYRTLFPNAGLRLPVTERVAERVLVLPTGPTIGADEIRGISLIIRLAVTWGLGQKQQPWDVPVDEDEDEIAIAGEKVAV